MAVLSGVEPKNVFKFFEDLCGIPHGSGNTKKISDYCVSFAKARGFRYIQDKLNNVVIFKDGTEGYENSAPVMIQGHLDMVCEKTADCNIDFENDGLTIKVENGIISAEGTTLGGDDGIAVAMGLALLDSKDIPHPPLEVVFTVDEEIGMLGAAALDCSPLKSRLMLNIDSEDEGILLVSCAGGTTATCRLPIKRRAKDAKGLYVEVRISGLTGGHSGIEIDKGRANSNMLMGRFLNELDKKMDFGLISVNGGLKDNAIPIDTAAELVIDPENLYILQNHSKEYERIFSGEYRTTDKGLSVTVTPGREGTHKIADKVSKKHFITALVNLPGGIQRMSVEIPGLVQTSLNMGILKTTDKEALMSFAVRSSVSSEKAELVSRLKSLMDILGGSVECVGDYPAWEYKPDSLLRDLMVDVFEEQYGKKPLVQAIHAGVECGLFAGKLPGLDCVSLGPDMNDIHTPNESINAASVERTWKYVLEVLRRLK